MQTFKYKVRGNSDVNDDKSKKWFDRTIEAEDIDAAEAKLDDMYGVKRDNAGAPINKDFVEVEIVN